jgi:hypothetical protein
LAAAASCSDQADFFWLWSTGMDVFIFLKGGMEMEVFEK